MVDIGQGYAVTFKIESHNHPSYVEPYQGAATGVGGIVRDILAMGARPIGVMDPLRFGPLDEPDTARVLPGVVAGVGGYGNCLGLPNIGGEVVFDRSYLGNPLVNALCVGVLRHEDLHLAHARGVGNRVILYGAATGGDGIGGVSVLASETFDATKPEQAAQRPGRRPVHGEAADRVHPGAVRGRAGHRHPGPRRRRAVLRHLRAGQRRRRRACSSSSTPVPLRDSTLSPEEILMSESQERMMAVVEPQQRRGVPGHLPQVGRAGHGDRRRHRRRPAGDQLARRADRRRAPAYGRPRGSGLRAAVRPAGLAGRAAEQQRRRAGPPDHRGRAGRDDPLRWSPRPTCATSPG